MAKSAHQKRKLFYLLSLLQEQSDENHPIPMTRILEFLASKGIHAERKSIYSDMEELRVLGYDVEYTKERPEGYYLLSREFELAELKLLVDAVQASKFVTEKQSYELIRKLKTLTSCHEAEKLQRQIYLHDRIKSDNMSTLYLIDDIHHAINNNRMITFTYHEWNLSKKLVPKHDGKRYQVSPWTLVWEDENYYLVAFDKDSNIMKYFRVDKMKEIQIMEEMRQGKDVFEKMDFSHFSQKTFGMYAGEETRIMLKCDNSLIGVMLDRFGSDIMIIKENETEFCVSVKVNISKQFYGWLAGLGKYATIKEPVEELEKYRNYLKSIIE